MNDNFDKYGMRKVLNTNESAHYSIFEVRREDGMDFLKTIFPDGVADELNFVLFSTSGIHGGYELIEDLSLDKAFEDDEPYTPRLTFLVIKPRIVSVTYGNCIPKSESDIAFLKRLRATSLAAVSKIGFPCD